MSQYRKFKKHQQLSSRRETLELYKRKNEANVKEILRMREVVRNEKAAAELAVAQVTHMCEEIIRAAMGDKEEITIYPNDVQFDGKVVVMMHQPDGGMLYRLAEPGELADQEDEEENKE